MGLLHFDERGQSHEDREKNSRKLGTYKHN